MGAEQSTNRDAGVSSEPTKTCYYEILSIERSATEDEIKKAYRRKALELHPDRNLDDTVNATRKFAEVQTAYEILSDPQERSWYDSHRDAILRGDNGQGEPGQEGAASTPQFFNNVRLTSTEALYHLMGRFSASVPMDDSPHGFYGSLGDVFDHLVLEEQAACRQDGRQDDLDFVTNAYPAFGRAHDGNDVAKAFYRIWSGFATRKSFAWVDKYRLADAPDRYVKRQMVKENRKARERAIRDFNDAVRALVAFVRKRDRRYLANTQTEAARQQGMRDAAAAQAARQRAANQERLAAAAAAAATTQPVPPQPKDEWEGSFSSSEEEEVLEIECVVCAKSFKSEKQFEAHEKSKKHIKAVNDLRRQMRKENKDFKLGSVQPVRQAQKGEPVEEAEEAEAEEEEAEEAEAEDEAEAKEATKEAEAEEAEAETDGVKKGDKNGINTKPDDTTNDDDDDGDEYAPKKVVQGRFGAFINSDDSNDSNESGEDDGDGDGDLAADLDGLDINQSTVADKKMGKAKLKKQKRAARREAAEASGEAFLPCLASGCPEKFKSNKSRNAHVYAEHQPTAQEARKAVSAKRNKKNKRK